VTQNKELRKEWKPTPIPAPLLQAARGLRKNMTEAEPILWQCLRRKQLAGFRLRKQHPLERFVLDFSCASAKLSIELDGGQHNTPQGHAADSERTAWLKARGIRVLRFWNHEVLQHPDAVVQPIWNALHPCPLPSPPPLGEGAEQAAECNKPIPPAADA
jgi:very-short-patch-repair endonuclease